MRTIALLILVSLCGCAARRPPIAAAPPEAAEIDALSKEAGTLYDQGKRQEAIPKIQRALDLSEKAFGPQDPRVARQLTDLSQLYDETGRERDADPLIHRASRILDAAADSDDVAVSLNNLALRFYAR